MATGYLDTEQAVLNMLHQREVMTMDDILISGQTDFSWAQVFLAIDRLSRQGLITLYRIGSNYQIALSTQAHCVGKARSTKL